ncbi:MAG TPA: leishmanolysin-related zinc metalloendopeptidase [Gemmatimonadales bacterium]
MRGLPLCSLLIGAAMLAACADDDVSSPATSPSSELSQAKAGDPLPKLSSASLEETDFPGVPEAAQKFQITLRFINPPTENQRSQFETAAARWQGIIHGDVLETVGTIPANGCGASIPLPAFTGTIDDIMINVLLQPIDGPGNVLGRAGACFVRTNDGLPLYGVMFFDTDDLAFLEQNSLLDEVVVHEMGHVLGFSAGIFNLNIPGVFSRSLLANPNTTDPRFVGAEATSKYRSVGGKLPNVPIEGLPCGPGTANSHWDEHTFFNELMTGFINGASANFINPLSRMTSAAMLDLGYNAVPSVDEGYDLQASPNPDPCAPVTTTSGKKSTAIRGGDGIDIATREVILEPVGRVE